MALMQPVILLSTANSSTRPLKFLSGEFGDIQEALKERVDKQHFMLNALPFVSRPQLFRDLNRYMDRVIVFHFAGHASQKNILLNEQDSESEASIFTGGVIPKLIQQNGLQLVFLNGCFTREQAKAMIAEGIKVVIATERPVEDEKAGLFAKEFYETLVTGKTIEQSFNAAKGAIIAKYNEQASKPENRFSHKVVEKEGYRDLELEGLEENQSNFAWHLFYSDTEDLKWQLPDKTILQKQYPIKVIEKSSDAPNIDELIIKIFNEILDYENKLVSLLEFEREPQDLQSEVITRFPPRVYKELEALLNLDTLDYAYFQQMIRSFEALMEVVLFAMLSQLWDFLKNNTEVPLAEELVQDCLRFLELGETERMRFKYLPLIQQISSLFEDHQFPFFIEEYEALREEYYDQESETKDSNTKLFEALNYMDNLKNDFPDFEESENLSNETIKKCEACLITIFSKLGFCVLYKIMSVGDIRLEKSRFKEDPNYLFNRAFVEKSSPVLPVFKEKLYCSFTENLSVLLLKKIDDVSEYLNLTPFIFDHNQLKHKIAPNSKSKPRTCNLYYYYYYNKENQEFVYRNSNGHDKVIIGTAEMQFGEIWTQIDFFKQDLTRKSK